MKAQIMYGPCCHCEGSGSIEHMILDPDILGGCGCMLCSKLRDQIYSDLAEGTCPYCHGTGKLMLKIFSDGAINRIVSVVPRP